MPRATHEHRVVRARHGERALDCHRAQRAGEDDDGACGAGGVSNDARVRVGRVARVVAEVNFGCIRSDDERVYGDISVV